MTIRIQGKDCAFCLLFVAEDGDDHDYECLLHARDRAKDGPGDSCPGPGEYDLVPVEGMKVDALLQAAKRIDPTVSWVRITVGKDVTDKPYVSVTLFAEERVGAGGCTLNEPERGEGTAETFDLAVKDALEQLKERKR